MFQQEGRGSITTCVCAVSHLAETRHVELKQSLTNITLIIVDINCRVRLETFCGKTFLETAVCHNGT